MATTDKEIRLEKWLPSEENPISKASDITYNKDTISQFNAGMKTANDKHPMIEYTPTLSNEPFLRLKKNPGSCNGLKQSRCG